MSQKTSFLSFFMFFIVFMGGGVVCVFLQVVVYSNLKTIFKEVSVFPQI